MKINLVVATLLFLTVNAQAQFPYLKWGKFTGVRTASAYADKPLARADKAGNVYTVGVFTGTVDMNSDTGATAVQNFTSAGGNDIYIVKRDSTGKFIWAKQIGNNETEVLNTLSIDDSSNITFGGAIKNSVDFDPSANLMYVNTPLGIYNAFLCKLDANGNLVWAKNIANGTANSYVDRITQSAQGDYFVAGRFGITTTVGGTNDFNPSANTTTLTASYLNGETFIAQYTSQGNLVWVKATQGATSTSNKSATGITLDNAGNIIVIGNFSGTVDFNMDTAAVDTAKFTATGTDAFVCKYNTTGTYTWAHQYTGASTDDIRAIAIDAANNIYTTGTFTSTTINFNPQGTAATLTRNGTKNGYVTKLDTAGTLVWYKGFGGSGSTIDASAIAIDKNNNLWWGGWFFNNLDFNPGVPLVNENGTLDLFVARYDTACNYVWHRKLTGGNNRTLTEITITPSNGILFTGTIDNPGSLDIDPSSATLSLATGGLSGHVTVLYKECAKVTANITSQANNLCNGDNKGEATLQTTGGVTNYAWTPNVSNNNLIDSLVAGTYTCILTNACGATATKVVTITQPAKITKTQTINICAGDSLIIGTHAYTNAGTYKDTLTSYIGCDSIVTTTVTKTTLNLTVTINGTNNTLTATQATATYQWLKCDSAYAPIAGATGKSYIVNASGNYAVIVTKSSCSDTSACVNFSLVGTKNINGNNLVSVYPNPADDKLNIVANQKQFDVEVRNALGQVVIKKVTTNTKQLDITELVSGVYILQLTANGAVYTVKFIKE
ncbi:MAG: T9SS type A sorting domain-containing protein [Bacteroidia bacterium]